MLYNLMKIIVCVPVLNYQARGRYGTVCIVRESQSGSRAQVAAMLPVCTMYDHLDRYKA